MKTANIHLGYEIGTGKPVSIPLKHMCITGQTQESGKTTTLEALITRSGLRAIAFITKRGEASFDSGRQIQPYFEERTDWEFIESVLEAIMRQKMKFERAWIVRATKGAHSLAEVQSNIPGLIERAKRGMDKDVYMLLGEYLQKVVPLIQRLPKSSKVEIAPGLNVMDLCAYPEELQHLVISSTIRWIYQHEQDVITIVPEAWKFAPQGRNTPVKVEIRKLAREGAGLKNYIWIDSQDIAGVEKEILRAAAVWLIGVQREQNEIERSLESIPKGITRPAQGEIPRLKIGEFFACWGDHVHKVYVQPAWLPMDMAERIAAGDEGAKEKAQELRQRELAMKGDGMDWKQKFEEEKQRADHLEAEILELRKIVNAIPPATSAPATQDVLKQSNVRAAAKAHVPEKSQIPEQFKIPDGQFDVEGFYQVVKERLRREAPAVIKLLAEKPEIQLTIERPTISMSTSSLDGNVARLIHDGFFNDPRGNSETIAELNRRGWKTIAPRMSDSFTRFNKMGFLYQEGGKYRAVEDAKKRVVAA